MLPALKRPKQKEQSDLTALMQMQIQLQKQMMEKAEERNMAALNLVAQSFQELRNECSNMTAILEKIAKLQTYAVKAEKNTLSEIKEMNKGLRDSDKGEMIRNRVESIAASEMPSAKSEDRERLDIKNQFQINIFPNISKVEKVNTKDAQNQEKQQKIQSEDQGKDVKANEKHQEKELQLIQKLKVDSQSREQIILIPVKSCESQESLNQLDSVKETISLWVGKTYDALIKQSFNGYFKRDMQESEAKVFFCQNLMLNFLELLDYLQKEHSTIWQQNKDELMEIYEKKAQQTLSYYLVKYPQKKKMFIDPSIRKSIHLCNYSQSPEFNTMINVGCHMKFESSGIYFSSVKKFINALISESLKNFPEFKSTMKEIFTFQKDSGEKYELDNLIGTKFREGTPLYTEEQIKLRGIEIKTPQVLRVMMKWIQQLQQIMQNPYNYFGERDDPFPNRNKSVVASIPNPTLTNRIAGQITTQVASFNEWQKQNKKLITSACKKLSNYCQVAIDQFKNIQVTEIKKTLPAYAVSQVVASTAISKLNKLIELINQSVDRMQKTKEDEDLEFIPFSVSDLLRCKCSGTVSEVIEVVKRLQSHDQLSIVRIKDRLNTGNQDFLINVKMKNCGVLCEIQVGFTQKSVDKKMEFLDHFNHFLYELARSEYGPLAESTLIASNLTVFHNFYEKALQQINKVKIGKDKFVATSKQIDKIQIEGFERLTNDFSFVCSSCLMLRRAHTSFLKVFKNQKIDQFICGTCSFENLSEQDKSTYFLGPVTGQFFKYLKTKKQIFNRDPYKVIIPIQQNKSILMLTKNNLGTGYFYSHVFYEFNQQILFFSQDMREIVNPGKAFTLALKQNIFEKIVDTEEFIKQIDKNQNIQLSKLIKIKSRRQQPQPSYLSEQKKLAFALENITFQKLSKCQRLICLTDTTIPHCLVIDALNKEFNIERIAQSYITKKKIQKVTKSINMTWNLRSLGINEEKLHNIQIVHNLKRLKLNANYIRSLNLFKCESLQQLYLDRNKISKIQNTGQFHSLQILQISQNNLQNLQNANTFTELRVLTADKNRISQLKFTDLPKSLQTLSLASNKIQKIEGQFNSSSLLSINLQRNQITEAHLENIFVNSLTSLTLTQNYLTRLVLPQNNFHSLRNLKAPLNYRLTQLDVSELRFLQYLDVQQCSLTSINFGSENLVQLNLPKNRLKQLKFNHPCPRLEKILGDYNYLKQLDLTPVGPIDNLNTISLSYNHLSSFLFVLPKTVFKLEWLCLIVNDQPIRFSSPIKRLNAPDLRTCYVGGDQTGGGFDVMVWLLKSITQEKIEEFIGFVNREQGTQIDGKDAEVQRVFMEADRSRLGDYVKGYFQFPEMVKKYFGLDPKSKKLINLVEDTTGEYIIETSV